MSHSVYSGGKGSFLSLIGGKIKGQPDHGFPGGSKEYRIAKLLHAAKIPDHGQVHLVSLSKSDAGIQHDLVIRDAGRFCQADTAFQIFQKIREDILNGRYKEHDELRENTLGKELGVSRTPVREALRQLELEGLVTIIPNRGAYVTGISRKDIWDIYAMRSMLEGLCARWASEHITDEQLDKLEEAILLSEFQIKKESGFNASQVAVLDGQFHAILYEASGSRILSHVLTDFHNYVKMARVSSVVSEERARKSIREHRQILRAIRERDADMAEQLANEHIMHVMQNLKKQGYNEN